MIKQGEQIEDSPKTIKKETRRQPRTPNRQPDILTSLYSEIHSANPILPPGIHKEQQEPQSLKYRYLLDKSKLNKTTFPEVRARNWLNQTQSSLTCNKPNDSVMGEHSNDEQKCQFDDLTADKVVVYCRVNNRKYNRIERDQTAFYCSLFVNPRKQEIKSRKMPVFEYLPRVYKDMKVPDRCEDVLNFNSSFESGNLFYALKCTNQLMPTYELYMQNDINTKGCTQWFYFSAWAQRRLKFKIKLMNFYKPTSLFMSGMKVLMSTDQLEWKRIGTAIKYYRINLKEGKQSFCLQFMFEIEQPLKQYYFCSGFPYTYTHLQNTLVHLSQTPLYPKIAVKSILCQTFLGNNVSMLTISNNLRSKQPKPIIYVIARQHPGETPGSLIVEGIMKTMLSSRLEMEELRENFTIKIVPMINIDGVVNGNYRSNFSGNDVNRQWLEPSRKLHPEIWTLKQQILATKKQAHFFLDIHAHSRKMNSFFYGSKGFNLDNRLYPFICSKLNKNISFTECSFVDDPSKKTTARVVLESEANIKKSLTFEASFYGYEDQTKKIKNHFKQQDLKGLGQSLALGLYYSEIGSVKYTSKTITEQQKITKKQQNESARNSVSCHLGQQTKKYKKVQVQQKIQKNCARIMEKWKKQLQKFNRQEDDVISVGSSLNPEHFELTQFEEQQIQKLNSQELKKETQENPQYKVQKQKQRHSNSIAEEKYEEDDSYIKEASKNQQSKSVEDSMKMSFFPIQSNLRNSLVVKKLQSELQMQRTHRRYESFRADKDRQREEKQRRTKFGNQIVQGQRFKSIDVQARESSNNYKNNIMEMKKALKYFMENKSYDYKSTDYDDYKAYLKYSTNGTTLVFSEKDSIARIKKKYTRL